MVPFAGWEMPVQYEGVMQEHRAVRADAGAFDVSHMGEIDVEGPRAHELLQSLLSNDLGKLEPGRAQYTLLTNEHGGIIDDLIAYRLEPHHYLLVVNASNREADFRWLKEREIAGTEIRDVSDEYALIAVQGPHAIAKLGLEPAPAFTFATETIDGVECMVNRTGYTGEDGCEILCMAEDAVALWDAVLARGVVPCGLGARDTLRLEASLPLHGNDIGPDTDAVSAGLGWTCALAAKEFTGSHVLRRIKEEGPERKLVVVRHGGQGGAAPGNGDRGRRRGHLGDALADARRRDRHGLRPRPSRGAGNHVDRRRAGQAPPRAGREETDLQEGGLMAAAESYPDDLQYHREHDWARIEGDEARLRDHVVRAGRARRARPLRGARDRLRPSRRTARTARSSR